MTDRRDNAPPLDGYAIPERPMRRCCGEWQATTHCLVCGNVMPTELALAPLIVLGEN